MTIMILTAISWRSGMSNATWQLTEQLLAQSLPTTLLHATS